MHASYVGARLQIFRFRNRGSLSAIPHASAASCCSALPHAHACPRLELIFPWRFSVMRRLKFLLAAFLLLAASLPAFATVFATVHGVVHDPEHRPIAGATVTLQSADSAFELHATTERQWEFELPQAPIGVYRLTVEAKGFDDSYADTDRGVRHESGTAHSTRVSAAPRNQWLCAAPPARPTRQRRRR